MTPERAQPKHEWQRPVSNHAQGDGRLECFRFAMIFVALFVLFRLGVLQALDHDAYAALATGQHALFQQLYPERGRILVHDLKDDALVPIALNETKSLVYADPRTVKDAAGAASALGTAFGYDAEKTAALAVRLGSQTFRYVPIERHVAAAVADAIDALKLPGVAQTQEEARLYPETSLGGHVVGFVGSDASGALAGHYGIEGYFDKELAGTAGSIRSEKDISGNLIAIGDRSITPAVNGSDVVLTIDRAIQYEACAALHKAVAKHQADGGSVVIVEPSTGRILAMCGDPDFDPNAFGSAKDVSVFNNPAIFSAYEPGSIFKPVTLAAAIDAGALLPTTTYVDTGSVQIGKFTIKNAEGPPRGLTTMTQALVQSLNTGMIFAMRKMGQDTFKEYVDKFGFGERTGVELDTEVSGNVSSLEEKGEVFSATASFGQGITVTPLQMAAAYAAIANGGILKKAYVVDGIRHADGTMEKRQPTDVRRVIESKTARLLGAMLVGVVEDGSGKRAQVPGYYIAGKTGTAQVASSDGTGYSTTQTIGSFAGFGPVENPRFAMVVRIDNPKGINWAESTAGPLFGEIASFLVKYLDIPPTR